MNPPFQDEPTTAKAIEHPDDMVPTDNEVAQLEQEAATAELPEDLPEEDPLAELDNDELTELEPNEEEPAE